MRHSKSVLIALVAQCVALPASAKSLYLDLSAAGETQTSRMADGLEGVESALPNGSVRVFENDEKVKKRGQFAISVFNASHVAANIGTENVTIAFGGGKPVAVLSYEKLLKEEKKRNMWAALALGLSAASNNLAASQAGYSSGTASYSGTTFGRYGTYNSFGSASYSGYNGAAAYAAMSNANLQNQIMFDRFATAKAINRQALKSNLRTTTVDPGGVFGGVITFEIPQSDRSKKAPLEVRIIVEFAGEKHEFNGQLVRR